MTLEYQRYGRNKETLIDMSYIGSGGYRRKFDNITNNPVVNKTLYDCAKKALKHRSGTEFEDMYWIDGNSGDVIYFSVDSTEERAVEYTKKVKSVLSQNCEKKIITLHTHPSSMPPSIEDFNSCCKHGYYLGLVICHNGTVFEYSAADQVSSQLYQMYIQRFLNDGANEYIAQIKALEIIKENHSIDFKEVL